MHAQAVQHHYSTCNSCTSCGDRPACASTGLPLDDVSEIMRLLQVFSPEKCHQELQGKLPMEERTLHRAIEFLDGFSHICPRWSDSVI